MTAKENYNCPVEATLELIGGKYKSLIMWHLSAQTLRFGELHALISKATPKMLTQQLREMESAGMVKRVVYPVVPPKVEYSLTDFGISLVPIIKAMYDWGADYLDKEGIEITCSMGCGQAASPKALGCDKCAKQAGRG